MTQSRGAAAAAARQPWSVAESGLQLSQRGQCPASLLGSALRARTGQLTARGLTAPRKRGVMAVSRAVGRKDNTKSLICLKEGEDGLKKQQGRSGLQVSVPA